MKTLNVNIEINGSPKHVGTITGTNSNDAVFCYAESYLNIPDIKPISCSLPLQREVFSAVETRNYFEGLLPEGFSRKSVANWLKSAENDYITILDELGKECLGAIYIGDASNLSGNYRPLEISEVKALAAEGATKSTQLLVETHLSLTGASGKVGLYYDSIGDKWYLPNGSMPSTHIVKQSHIRLSQMVLNEFICIKTAENLGIPVSDSFIINLGNGNDSDILFATRRYDRKPSEKSIDNLPVPYRLHQEDFAQALNIPAANKYETSKNNYLARMFNLISRVASNPIKDQLLLWDIFVFNYLIGNTDGHIKNYSLVYDNCLRKIELAPAYDIICTGVYGAKKEMSLFIGNKICIDSVTRSDFKAAATEAGLGTKMALEHLDNLANRFDTALTKSIEATKELGFIQADTLGSKIMSSCGMRYLN